MSRIMRRWPPPSRRIHLLSAKPMLVVCAPGNIEGKWILLASELDLNARKNLQRVLVKDLELVLCAQELQTVDDREEIVRRLSRVGPDRSTGSGELRPEHHLVHPFLLDRRGQEVHVIRAAIIEEVFAEILLREVMVRRDEAVEGAAAVADHDLQAGEGLENVAVRENMHRDELFDVVVHLVIVRDHLDARVEAR